MTGENHMFWTLTLKDKGSVGFGEGQKGKIIGMDTIGNSLIYVNNVWLVSGLTYNLLSIIQFCDNGYEVFFNKNFYSIINESDKSILSKGKRKGNVYKINLSELTYHKVVFLMSLS